MAYRGVLLEAAVPLFKIYFSYTDEYNEHEALVKGLVRGAKVYHFNKDDDKEGK